MSYNIVLCEPEIPQNTGNISRTCAVTGTRLHLIRPFGFEISDRTLKRAGLDYWNLLDVSYYDNLEDFYKRNPDANCYYASTKSLKTYCDVEYSDNDYIMFGKETKGLDEALLLKNRDKCIRIPMIDEARSLNLSNSVAIVLYEALRQGGFNGLLKTGQLHNLKW